MNAYFTTAPARSTPPLLYDVFLKRQLAHFRLELAHLGVDHRLLRRFDNRLSPRTPLVADPTVQRVVGHANVLRRYAYRHTPGQH
jgi:hypothetical protein